MEGGNHQASGPVDQLLNLIDGKPKGQLTENLLQGESSETFGIDNGLHICQSFGWPLQCTVQVKTSGVFSPWQICPSGSLAILLLPFPFYSFDSQYHILRFSVVVG